MALQSGTVPAGTALLHKLASRLNIYPIGKIYNALPQTKAEYSPRECPAI